MQRAVRQPARLVQVDEGGHCVEHCLAEQRRAAPPLADDDDHRPLAERAASGDLPLLITEFGSVKKWDTFADLELAAEDLRMATRHLGGIVGKVDVEEILGSIFKDFCIGK